MSRSFTNAILLLCLLSIGCGSDGGPIAPEDPGVEPLDALAFDWLNRSPQGDELLASAAFASTRILVGGGGAVVLRHGDGDDWRRIQAPTRRLLSDVVLLSETHAMATGQEGVLESTDGGENWRFLHRDPLAGLGVLAASGSVVVAGGEGRVLFSTDTGKNFKAVDLGTSARVKGLAFLSEKTILALLSSGFLFRSDDAGESWQPVGNDALVGSSVAMDFPTPSRGTVITRNPARAYFSSDAGATWSVAQEFPAQVRAVDFFDGGRGLAITELGALFLTENDGKSWAFQQDRVLVTDGVAYHTLLAVGEQERIVGGQAGFLAETSNSGFFWQEKSDGFRESLREIGFPSADLGFALISNELHQSRDGGHSWEGAGFFFSGGLDMDFLDSSRGVMIGHAGKLYQTDDGGESWLRRNNAGSSFDHVYEGIAMLDDESWVLVGAHDLIQLTTDAGQSYTGSFDHESGLVHLDVAFFPGTRTGLVVGFDLALRSVDGGVSWTPMAAPSGGRAIHCLDERTAVIVGEGVHLTLDGGSTWTQVADTGDEELHDVDFADDRRGMAVGDAGLLLQSLNGGRSWVETLATGTYLFAASFRDADSGLIGGENGALLEGVLPTQ